MSQAARTFRISQRTLSYWASQGLIASIKGEGANSHRLLHIENILAFIGDQLQSTYDDPSSETAEDKSKDTSDSDDEHEEPNKARRGNSNVYVLAPSPVIMP